MECKMEYTWENEAEVFRIPLKIEILLQLRHTYYVRDRNSNPAAKCLRVEELHFVVFTQSNRYLF